MTPLQEKIIHANAYNDSHSADLYKRHLFATLQDFSYTTVQHYKGDYHCDALKIENELPGKAEEIDTIVLWYAWRDSGTHLWIEDGTVDMMRFNILKYLKYDTHVVKVVLSRIIRHGQNLVQVTYSLVKEA